MQYLSNSQWISAPTRSRWAVMRALGILPHGMGKVVSTPRSTQVVSDMWSEEDLEGLTPEVLQKYTGSNETEFTKLWQLALDKALAEDIELYGVDGNHPPVPGGETGAVNTLDQNEPVGTIKATPEAAITTPTDEAESPY